MDAIRPEQPDGLRRGGWSHPGASAPTTWLAGIISGIIGRPHALTSPTRVDTQWMSGLGALRWAVGKPSGGGHVDQGTVLQAYARAWAERDEEAIRSWLGICWSERSTYVNPFTDIVRGIDGLTALIMDYPVMFPDVAIRPFGEPRRRHEFVAWPWRMSSTCRIRVLGRDFGRELAGSDVVRFDEDGRLADVVAFICGAANDTGDGPLVKCVEEALTAASEPQLTRG